MHAWLSLIVPALIAGFLLSNPCKVAAVQRVAIVGGGLGGTSAAYYLRQLAPDLHLELFEIETRLGGRTEEFAYNGQVYELGASIIHAQNQHVLTLAKAMNLTLQKGDDTDSAFSIWDGSRFVFTQAGASVLDIAAVLLRYGISPLRYKWLAQEMAARFARIYTLQQQGQFFTTPEDLLAALGLFEFTQTSAADYMKTALATGVLRYGADRFIEELAAAVNRVNYNQPNEVLNAMAGLVSYLPAAEPEVYSIKQGNSALSRRLAAAAELDALHLATAVLAVSELPAAEHSAGAPVRQYNLTVRKASSATGDLAHIGPYDAVLLATPLEYSDIQLQLIDEDGQLPMTGQPSSVDPQKIHNEFQQIDAEGLGAHFAARQYQTTVTSFVVGELNPSYFKLPSMPPGDVFVTNSAATPFSVLAHKGQIDDAAAAAAQSALSTSHCRQQQMLAEDHGPQDHSSRSTQHYKQLKDQQLKDSTQNHQQQQQQSSPNSHQTAEARKSSRSRQSQEEPGQRQLTSLWKVFSVAPLTVEEMQQLFINGSVLISKTWRAYPRFSPPERFAKFQLASGVCYNNPLESSASALEVAAVAGRNCALLLHEQLVIARSRKSSNSSFEPQISHSSIV